MGWKSHRRNKVLLRKTTIVTVRVEVLKAVFINSSIFAV
jgi:hypothetical protein